MTCRALRPAAAATALLGLVLVAAPPARTAQSWTVVPVAEPVATLFEARASDGALHLLYRDAATGRVRDAVSRDAGTTWVLRDVSEGDAVNASFDLTFDATNQTLSHVVYAGEGLTHAVADGDSTAWTRTTLDAAPEAGTTGLAVAARADTVAVLYRKAGSLWLTRSTDDGETWGAATEVAAAGPGLLSLAIAPSGALHALFPFPDGSGPVHARSTDGGTNWTLSPVAGGAMLSGSRQLLVLEPGLIVAAFGAGSEVRLARSADEGASWRVETFAAGSQPALALDAAGTYHLAWRGAGDGSVPLASSVDAHSWSREAIGPAPGAEPRDALVAVPGAAVFVPFVRSGDGLVVAWNGGPPGPPVPVDVTGDASTSDAELAARLESQWYDPIEDDWYFRYALSYRNRGPLSATNVSIDCAAPAATETVEAVSWLPLSGMREPRRMVFGVGTLGRFDGGRAWLTVRLPGPAAPGTELLMQAEMSNDNTENDADDNAAEVRHAVPLLAPLVATPPLGGQTCRSDLEFAGAAQPGVTAVLRRDGLPAGSAPVGDDGSFAIALSGLADGDHVVSVAAEHGGGSSPAPQLTLTVDAGLAADPLGIVLIDEEGRVQRLNDGLGQARIDGGWRGLRLAPGASYTLGVPSCCPTPPALQAWWLAVGGQGGETQPFEYDEANGRFTAPLGVPAETPPGSRVPLTLTYRCAPADPMTTLVATGGEDGPVVAAGRVYDSAEGKGIADPVAGIVATLWSGRPATGLGGIPAVAWAPWAAERFGAAPNPQETGPDGFAPFYPPPGRYRWTAFDPTSAFEAYGSLSRPVVEGAFDPDVPLSEDDAITRRIVLAGEPVSGRLNVAEGDVVEWVNADDRPHRVRALVDPALGTGGWDSGEIPPGGRYRRVFAELGDYIWTDDATGGEARLVVRELFVTPEAGTEGTDLVISDEGFGSGKGKVEVGGTACKVKNWTDTQVVCGLREVLAPAIYDVRVIPKKNPERLYAGAFEARAPILRSLLPTSGKKGTKVRLSGSYWGTKKGTVTVGGTKAKVSAWLMGPSSGDSVIEIKIPKLEPGTYDIAIEAPTGSATLASGFTVE